MVDSPAVPGGPPSPGDKLKVQVWIHCVGRVLLLKTIPERGEFWQPVTGSVEPGESLAEAALREAREETGLAFVAAPLPLDYDFRFRSRFGHVQEHSFSLEAPSAGARLPGVTIDPKEHLEFQWVRPDDALRWLKFESNRKALEILMGRNAI